MNRIFIEGKELDVSKELSNSITKAIDDIRNIDSKSTSFSQNIVLPGTAKNNMLFGFIFDVNNSNRFVEGQPNIAYNFNAAKQAQARIEYNGLSIMKGGLRLLEIINSNGFIEYECVIFGELGGFVTALGNKKIEDLDFSNYDTVFTVSGITNSWDLESSGMGIIYPHIDYGTYGLNNKKDWKVGTFRPAFFVREILSKIIANSGYTWDFPLIDTERFKRLIVPNTQKVLAQFSNVAFLVETSGVTTTGTSLLYQFPFTTLTTLGNFTANVARTIFTYNSGTNLTGRVRLRLNGSITADTGPVEVQVRKNSTVIYSDFYDGLVDIDITTASQTFALNDTLNVRILFEDIQPDVNNWSINITDGSLSVETDASSLVPININEAIRMNDVLPRNILQRDFFTSILKLFNLYVDEDTYQPKHLVIRPYPDYYSGEIIDWSDKLDRSKVIRIKPMSELNARYYQFKYKADNDFYNEQYRKRYNEGYGDRIFDSEFEFANETQSLELIFSATPILSYTGEDKRYSTIVKINNNVEESIDSNIRIMIARKITGIPNWNIRNSSDTSTLATVNYYCYAGHLDHPTAPNNDLNFGVTKEYFCNIVDSTNLTVNQFNVYYSPYMAEITDKDSRLMTAYFYLTPLDILNLDFKKYIFIDGGLFRLSKVIDYNPQDNATTKVELLKVINTEY